MDVPERHSDGPTVDGAERWLIDRLYALYLDAGGIADGQAADPRQPREATFAAALELFQTSTLPLHAAQQALGRSLGEALLSPRLLASRARVVAPAGELGWVAIALGLATHAEVHIEADLEAAVARLEAGEDELVTCVLALPISPATASRLTRLGWRGSLFVARTAADGLQRIARLKALESARPAARQAPRLALPQFSEGRSSRVTVLSGHGNTIDGQANGAILCGRLSPPSEGDVAYSCARPPYDCHRNTRGLPVIHLRDLRSELTVLETCRALDLTQDFFPAEMTLLEDWQRGESGALIASPKLIRRLPFTRDAVQAMVDAGLGLGDIVRWLNELYVAVTGDQQTYLAVGVAHLAFASPNAEAVDVETSFDGARLVMRCASASARFAVVDIPLIAGEWQPVEFARLDDLNCIQLGARDARRGRMLLFSRRPLRSFGAIAFEASAAGPLRSRDNYTSVATSALHFQRLKAAHSAMLRERDGAGPRPALPTDDAVVVEHVARASSDCLLLATRRKELVAGQGLEPSSVVEARLDAYYRHISELSGQLCAAMRLGQSCMSLYEDSIVDTNETIAGACDNCGGALYEVTFKVIGVVPVLRRRVACGRCAVLSNADPSVISGGVVLTEVSNARYAFTLSMTSVADESIECYVASYVEGWESGGAPTIEAHQTWIALEPGQVGTITGFVNSSGTPGAGYVCAVVVVRGTPSFFTSPLRFLSVQANA